MEPVSTTQMILGLVIGILSLVVLILKTRIHAFPALILAAVITGLVGGMTFDAVMGAITKGFGSTLGSIGIIIGLGIMMGAVFEKSGAARRMAKVFISLFGTGREEIALAVTGFIVSIPIFCDSGFVILAPLAKAISRNTGKSVITLGVALAGGLVITHHLVPPTPGPVAVAGYFGVSLGDMIMWGFALAVPVAAGVIFYARYIGTQIFQLPAPDGSDGFVRTPYGSGVGQAWVQDESDDKDLPGVAMAFAPILVPVILILMGTITAALQLSGGVYTLMAGLGNPVVAVGIGLLVAIFGLTGKYTREEVIGLMDKSVAQAGIILLVTGGGGALGMVLRDSGAGKAVAEAIAAVHMPAVILPFAIATIVRLLQGSGTVGMITAATIVAPMAATLGLNPVIGALACCSGAFIFSYFNDSYYWVVNRMLGVVEVREQIRVWSVATTVCWAISGTLLIIADVIL